MEYNFKEIEEKWQNYWRENKSYKVEIDKNRPKFYVLDMFPYPSGAGLHVGHPLGYIASDIFSRYKKMKGFNVLHPMGYDAFGLPAEQYAIQTGQHPAITTEQNIKRYREQLDKIGFSFDWDREIRTCNTDYYKWTQKTFTQLFNHWYNKNTDKAEPIEKLIEIFEKEGNANVNAATDQKDTFTAAQWNSVNNEIKQTLLLNYRLAYLADTMVNWCPELGTVLANDEVKDGLSERGGHPVVQKNMQQWSLRISAYAQRLLDGFENLDWSESLKEVQRNWIGKSEGTEMFFGLSPALSSGEGENQKYNTADKSLWSIMKAKSKEMRKDPTEAEAALWGALRNKKIGYKIRRQHVIDRFIPDFVCLSKKVIIEIDGKIHDNQKEEDELRTQILNNHGFEVIRYTNDEVLTSLDSVIEKIKSHLDNKVLPSGEDLGGAIEVFTTRADTVFGVTFMVLAPESILVDELTTPEQRAAVDAYIKETSKRSERERIADVKNITGVFTGTYAINPLTNEEIPVWISDYVLAGYGTGAIMAVPAHDTRDFKFAKTFNLPIRQVVVPSGEEATDPQTWEDSKDSKEGTMINSGFLDGMDVPVAIEKTKEFIKEEGLGEVKTNYRLRDAIFSRQRYWGEPFPIYFKEGLPYAVEEADLPVQLPEVDKYLPTEDGEPPLARAKDWKHKGQYDYEFSTMPGFAGSSAYYFRYMDPKNDTCLVGKEANEYWKSVDLYLGGSEHATGHLIYSRFWNKFLYDIGEVCEDEPFRKLINQGMIQGRSNFVYKIKNTNKFVSFNLRKEYDVQTLHVDVNIVRNDVLDTEAFKNWLPEYKNAEFILEDDKYVCGWAVEKMSKSKYNVVNPDIIVEKYGADTLRMYEMFLGPLELSKPWDTNGIDGVYKFLKKLWRLFYDRDGKLIVIDEAPTKNELKTLHKTIKKVSEDIENFSFNTSISAFMICVNELTEQKCHKQSILKELLQLLSPFAPHICEELWSKINNDDSITNSVFPEFNEEHLVEDTYAYPVSFNGKMRFKLELPMSLSKDEIEKEVLSNENAQKWLDGKTPKKVIVVPKKIVNIVI